MGISHIVIDKKYTVCIQMHLICLSSGEHNIYVPLYHCSRPIDVDVIGWNHWWNHWWNHIINISMRYMKLLVIHWKHTSWCKSNQVSVLPNNTIDFILMIIDYGIHPSRFSLSNSIWVCYPFTWYASLAVKHLLLSTIYGICNCTSCT